jgi:hypothetical protein
MKQLIRKLFKRRKGLFDQKINFILDERLNDVNLATVAPEKLEEANNRLSRMKSLPK